MERFDLYDKDMNRLPETNTRGEHSGEGKFHLVVHVWIRNDQGEFLIQQRNKEDDLIPYQWGITGGAVLAGETSMEGAIRETKEEIGIVLTPDQLHLQKRYFIELGYHNYITDLYLVNENILLNECKLDTVEVRDVAYKTMAEIKDMISANTFWDYERMMERTGYFDLLETSKP